MIARADQPREHDYGPCCACGVEGSTVRNFICLSQRAPVPGTGWGCFICGLPNDGALAVICERCADAGRPPVRAFKGFPVDQQYVPIAELAGEHRHDLKAHGLDVAKVSK